MWTNEELAIAIQAGNRKLLTQLWEQCYGFICQQARRWAFAWETRSDFDIDDLTQSGYIALCEAVKGFEIERGYSFISFLALHLKTEFSKVARCRTPAQLKDPLNSAISLDSPAYQNSGEDQEITIGDTIPAYDSGYEAVEEAMHREHIAAVVKEAVYSLPEKQCLAIEAHYLNGKPYHEIAATLQVANSYPGQLIKDGLKGLRKGKYAPILSELLWGDCNYYMHTGYSSWKNSGCSVQERLLIREEYKMRKLLRA